MDESRGLQRVVFALTSLGNDFYSTMTRVAVASLRITNPPVRVMVVCDRQTNDAMRQDCDPLISEVDEWITFDAPSGPSAYRNRFVKTRLRSLIDGPFLFLDSDILVRGDLREIFLLDCDIAGARNHSQVDFRKQVSDYDLTVIDRMGWEIGANFYFNGGVLFWNDTTTARKLGEVWHCKWLDSSTRLSGYRDQAALNAAINDISPKAFLLGTQYNAQFQGNPSVTKGALLWHFYSDMPKNKELKPSTTFELLVDDIIKTGKFDMALVLDMIRQDHPWRISSFLDAYFVSKMIQRGSAKKHEDYWLRRETLASIVRDFNNLHKKFLKDSVD